MLRSDTTGRAGTPSPICIPPQRHQNSGCTWHTTLLKQIQYFTTVGSHSLEWLKEMCSHHKGQLYY